jgi:hypothetical protein
VFVFILFLLVGAKRPEEAGKFREALGLNFDQYFVVSLSPSEKCNDYSTIVPSNNFSVIQSSYHSTEHNLRYHIALKLSTKVIMGLSEYIIVTLKVI